MNPSVRNGLIGLLSLTLPLSACAQQPAAAPAATVASIAQSTAPQIVTGLPDFTTLVEQVGPGVVTVTADIDASTRSGVQVIGNQDMPDIFKRFFGPDFQFPGEDGSDDDDGSDSPRSAQPDQATPKRRRPTEESMGSGFIISPDGYILTNNHVVEGAAKVHVKLSDGRELTAKVVGTDKLYDVALLKIEAGGLPSLRMGNSDKLKPGQWVVAIGSPLGLDHSVTAGVVSATGRANPLSQYVRFIQTDVAINRGNSGGPLLNTSGEVVGINSQIFSDSGGYMGISFAIPINLALSAADQLKKNGKVSRSMLGVGMQGNISDDDVKGFKLPNKQGALVASVAPDSGAEKAGIQPGDFITAFNGQKINSIEDLPPLVGPMPAGSKVTLTLVRDGKTLQVPVVLSELKTSSFGGQDDQDQGQDDQQQAAPKAGGNALGIKVEEVPAQLRQRLGLASGEGVVIASVSRQTAMDSGLQPGTVVLQVGRSKVNSTSAFDKAVAGYRKGEVVMLLVRAANGVNQFVAVTVGGAGKDDDQ
ncbi:MAG: Do family serine endopeptidase [Pseudoxanthomonas sp.]